MMKKTILVIGITIGIITGISLGISNEIGEYIVWVMLR